jgi:hypothetical protein
MLVYALVFVVQGAVTAACLSVTEEEKSGLIQKVWDDVQHFRACAFDN